MEEFLRRIFMIKKAGVEMNLIQKIKRIEQNILENFEELDLDDPIEEGYCPGKGSLWKQ